MKKSVTSPRVDQARRCYVKKTVESEAPLSTDRVSGGVLIICPAIDSTQLYGSTYLFYDDVADLPVCCIHLSTSCKAVNTSCPAEGASS